MTRITLTDLPGIRGTYEADYELAPLTTVKIGGPAEVFARFADLEDFCGFLAEKDPEIPLTILGEGSNVVIRDGGIAGVVTRLDFLTEVTVDGNTITAGAGATCGKVARAARAAGLTGLEFYGGIPGSIGGALMMNAGAYGQETVDSLVVVTLVDERGTLHEKRPAALGYRYRGCEVPEGWVFVSATYKLQPGDPVAIKEKMREVNTNRRTSQPLELPSSGSWFKNPTVNGEKQSAWKITEAAGCRGWREGDAQVSEKHCNFFVNLGNATAKEMDVLSQKVEAQILETQGIHMQREVRFIGKE